MTNIAYSEAPPATILVRMVQQQLMVFDISAEGRAATEPRREDIRLLGGMLGDVIREQEGDRTFDLVEEARRRSFALRRQEVDREGIAKLFEG